MGAPVNVKLEAPTLSIDGWQTQAEQWRKINPGNSAFYPLTIKAGYVIGVIYDICECVSHLLKYPSNITSVYIPAYGVFASGIELLGRSIRGNPSFKNPDKDLKFGFKWLASWDEPEKYLIVSDKHELIETNTRSYTIQELITLRHFAAHGQGRMGESSRAKNITNVDIHILMKMPFLIKNGLEVYWSRLQGYSGNDLVSERTWNEFAEFLCNTLAKANITPFRDWPVFRSWSLFDPNSNRPHPSITEIFERFEIEWFVSEN